MNHDLLISVSWFKSELLDLFISFSSLNKTFSFKLFFSLLIISLYLSDDERLREKYILKICHKFSDIIESLDKVDFVSWSKIAFDIYLIIVVVV
jgi:hypothetical protein